MNRAAIYVRTTPLSGEPDTRLGQLRSMAADRGLEVVAVYSERVWRATARRPCLCQLLSRARKGEFETVVVCSLVDIARTLKDGLEVIRELNRFGVGVMSYQDDLCISGEQADGSARVVNALYEMHRSLVSEAVRIGMRRSRLDGIPLGRRPVEMDRTAILRDRASGMSFASIAKKNKIGKATVYKLVAEASQKPSSTHPPPFQ